MSMVRGNWKINRNICGAVRKTKPIRKYTSRYIFEVHSDMRISWKLKCVTETIEAPRAIRIPFDVIAYTIYWFCTTWTHFCVILYMQAAAAAVLHAVKATQQSIRSIELHPSVMMKNSRKFVTEPKVPEPRCLMCRRAISFNKRPKSFFFFGFLFLFLISSEI